LLSRPMVRFKNEKRDLGIAQTALLNTRKITDRLLARQGHADSRGGLLLRRDQRVAGSAGDDDRG